MGIRLDEPLHKVLGDRTAKVLRTGLHLETVGDLLRHYPRRHVQRGQLTELADLEVGAEATVVAQITKVSRRQMQNRRGSILTVEIRDGHDIPITVTFFNQRAKEHLLKPGMLGMFAGKVTEYQGHVQLANPEFEKLDADAGDTDVDGWAGELIPIYPATAGLPSWKIAKCVRMVLDQMDDDPDEDPVPRPVRARQGLLPLMEAFRKMHRAVDQADFHIAKRRLKWDEALPMQVVLAQRREALKALPAVPRVRRVGGLLDAFDASLPFTLTAGQRAVGEEIESDLASSHPMHRLLQGDVGSGKTMVALRAMLAVVDAGGQAVLLAPTEVLAQQHHRSIVDMLAPAMAAGRSGRRSGVDVVEVSESAATVVSAAVVASRSGLVSAELAATAAAQSGSEAPADRGHGSAESAVAAMSRPGQGAGTSMNGELVSAEFTATTAAQPGTEALADGELCSAESAAAAGSQSGLEALADREHGSAERAAAAAAASWSGHGTGTLADDELGSAGHAVTAMSGSGSEAFADRGHGSAERAAVAASWSGQGAGALVDGEVGSAESVAAAVSQPGLETVADGELFSADSFRPGPRSRVALLTGSQNAKERRANLLDAASGAAGIVIGTHAVIQDHVQFADLGLVVIDEQHRFGVEQRDALRAKASDPPHVLVMTATPIPRTVAMTVFGDLETSVLSELPAGRSPIATHVVAAAEHPKHFQRVWERIREEIQKGHQAYVVCPRIGDGADNSDSGDGTDGSDGPGTDPVGDVPAARPPLAVLDVAAKLTEGPLKGLRVAMLHGRMTPEDKDTVMRAYTAGELDVLVATTVIEVGVNVPNSTVMAVLDADRFGVSQLHQLRGRVGRGSAPGLCLLVTESPDGSPARERLAAVASTLDGFELSRIDLELRKEGDVLGAAQSGYRSSLRLLGVIHDEDVIRAARDEATAIVAADPGLAKYPALAAVVLALTNTQGAEYLGKT